jgi:undecaprenyl-diphosphatase
MSTPKAVTSRAVYLRSELKTARPGSEAAAGYDAARGRIVLRVLVQVLLLCALMAGLGWLVTHQLVHVWPFSAEDSVDRTLAAHRDSALNDVTGTLSTVADTTCTVLLALGAIIVAWRVSGGWRAPGFIALALATEVSVFLMTTVLVHRARPGVVELDHSPPTSSFPSGHTAAAMVLYGAVAWLIARGTGRWQAWLLLLMPAAVAFARLYRGMHHPSDVVAGFLLGACSLLIAARAVLGGRR